MPYTNGTPEKRQNPAFSAFFGVFSYSPWGYFHVAVFSINHDKSRQTTTFWRLFGQLVFATVTFFASFAYTNSTPSERDKPRQTTPALLGSGILAVLHFALVTSNCKKTFWNSLARPIAPYLSGR